MMRYKQLGVGLLRVIESERRCGELVRFLTKKDNGVGCDNSLSVDVNEQSFNRQVKFNAVDENNLQHSSSFITQHHSTNPLTSINHITKIQTTKQIKNHQTIRSHSYYNNKQISKQLQYDYVMQQNYEDDQNQFIGQYQQLNLISTNNINNQNDDYRTQSYLNNKRNNMIVVGTKNDSQQKDEQLQQGVDLDQQQEEYLQLAIINSYSNNNGNNDQLTKQQQSHHVKIYKPLNHNTNNKTNNNCFNLSNFNSFSNNNNSNSINCNSRTNNNSKTNTNSKTNNYNNTQNIQQNKQKQFYQQQLVYLIKKIQLMYGRKLSSKGLKKVVNSLCSIAGINDQSYLVVGQLSDIDIDNHVYNQDKVNVNSLTVTTTQMVNSQRDQINQKDSNKYTQLFKLKDITNSNKVNNNNQTQQRSTNTKSNSKYKQKPSQQQQLESRINDNNKKIKFSTLSQSTNQNKPSNKLPLANIYSIKQSINNKENSFIQQQKIKNQKLVIKDKQKQRSLSPLSYKVLMDKKKQLKQQQNTYKKTQQNSRQLKKVRDKQNSYQQKNSINNPPEVKSKSKPYQNISLLSSSSQTPTQPNHNPSRSKPLSLKIILQQTFQNKNNIKNRTKTLSFEYQQNKKSIQMLKQIEQYCQQHQINKKNMNIIMQAICQHKPILTIRSIGL